jgi:ribokinase
VTTQADGTSPVRHDEPPRVVVVGDVALDVVAGVARTPVPGTDTPARTTLGGGGAGGNVAAWLAEAGADPLLVGRVGDDLAGRAAAGELAAAGVRLHLARDPGAPTGIVVAIATPDGERTMLPDRGANLLLRPEDLPADLAATGRHLHLSGYALLHPAPRPAALAALERARAAGLTTSVDASSAAPLADAGPATFLGWIEGVDVLRANAEEAALLAACDGDAEASAAALAEVAEVVVVSAGPGGAVAATAGTVLQRPAPRVQVVDGVGAGDALTAGFLAAWLRAPHDVEGALRAGVDLAARAVGVAGARPARR